MTASEIFDLSQLEAAERPIVEGTLQRFDFPFERLLAGLREQTGRSQIPIRFEDLSRFAAALSRSSGAHPDHVHHPTLGEGHLIRDSRRQVLGLAWYRGEVWIELSLVSNPHLAAEVLGAELAHMVHFFYMPDAMMLEIFRLVHDHMTPEAIEEHYGEHGVFEETGDLDYHDWVGEAWMGGFTIAYSDIEPDQAGFTHVFRSEHRARIREILGTDVPPTARYFASEGSSVFHDSHQGIRAEVTFEDYASAVASGRRACGVCKPTS